MIEVTFIHKGQVYTAEVYWDQISEFWQVLDIQDEDNNTQWDPYLEDAAIQAAQAYYDSENYAAVYGRVI